MASSTNHKKGTYNNQHIPTSCMQINLQHSRVATDNLKNIIHQHNTDIIFIQEPYLYQNKIAGITRLYRAYTSDEDTNRAAIILTDNIDAVLIK
jgi:hypothetical protein